MKLELNQSAEQIIRQRGLGIDGAVQTYIDAQALKEMDPYTPKDTGMLIGSGSISGPGRIVYTAPYARRLYYNTGGVDSLGRRYGPVRNFRGAPKRGSMWFERMKADGGAERILRGAARLAKARYERKI